MDLNNKLRRAFNVILEAVSELKLILTEKDKIKNDKGMRSRFEREVEKIGENIARTKIRNDLFKKFKDLRNDISHLNTTNTDAIINSVTENLPELEKFSEEYINIHFSNNTVLKAFEKFGGIGSQIDRAKFIDALLDKLTEKDKLNWTKFPNNQAIKTYTTQVEEIINHPDLIKLTQENQVVATQVTEDIVNWAKELHKKLATQNPFSEEENMLTQTKQLSSQDFFSNYEKISEYLSSVYVNGEINFNFFDKKLKQLDKRFDIDRIIKGELKEISKGKIDLKEGIEKFLESGKFKDFEKELPFNKGNYKKYAEKKAKETLQEAEALRQNFLKDWEKNLFTKKHKFELDEVDKARKTFMQSLYEKVTQFNQLKELLEPFTKDLGRLWDLSGGVWKNSGFELLKKFADILENDKAIKELAEMLGRYRKSEKEFEEVEIDKIIVKPKFKPQHANKGEVVGIRESDDISSMLPIEAATLLNPNTRPIFLKKFAEKKLMTYDFKNQGEDTERINIKERQLKEKEDGKGPIIICVDTSGSMQGTPERVAKTICFALTKTALKDKRYCFLISFSTKIQTIELTDLQNSLDKLVAFLGMSFNGGTDANPALEKALEMLETNDYKKADVLMVSDFLMDTLKKGIIENIEKAKTNKTRFHSLTISDNANTNVIKQFNHNWNYNIKGTNQNETLVKQLKEL
ncbi:MAG: VWA domain-containing protein [Salinivirgaceae bacterium]|nr:VWA domain-containing protein [Salinivirgaceae bacterium]